MGTTLQALAFVAACIGILSLLGWYFVHLDKAAAVKQEQVDE